MLCAKSQMKLGRLMTSDVENIHTVLYCCPDAYAGHRKHITVLYDVREPTSNGNASHALQMLRL